MKGKFLSWQRMDPDGLHHFRLHGDSKHEFLLVGSYWQWQHYGEHEFDSATFSELAFLSLLSRYSAGDRTICELSFDPGHYLELQMRAT